VLELAEPFQISLPAVSRHLKVLERAGLIYRGRDAQRRPCRLRPEALLPVMDWAEHTRQTWEGRFDRLGEYLRDVQRRTPSVFDHGSDEDDDPNRFRVTITFDRQGDAKTVVMLRQLHPSQAQRDATLDSGAVELGYQSLDRLAEYLRQSAGA